MTRLQKAVAVAMRARIERGRCAGYRLGVLEAVARLERGGPTGPAVTGYKLINALEEIMLFHEMPFEHDYQI